MIKLSEAPLVEFLYDLIDHEYGADESLEDAEEEENAERYAYCTGQYDAYANVIELFKHYFPQIWDEFCHNRDSEER